MEKPTNIEFTGLDVPMRDVFRKTDKGPMHVKWTRVQFTVDDPYANAIAVEEWLRANCPGEWESYTYTRPKGKNSDAVMVIRFENLNDAMMFKLRGGHQVWENS